MSNAVNRADEVRALVAEQKELDPDFALRVLKLCRMHEHIDETVEEERRNLRALQEKADRLIKKESATYTRLITRVHNQRVEINRLQRIIDERKASQSPEEGPTTQPARACRCEPGHGDATDHRVRGKVPQSPQSEWDAILNVWYAETDLSNSKEETE